MQDPPLGPLGRQVRKEKEEAGQGRGSSVPPGSWANLSRPICLLTSPPEAGESQYQEAARAEFLSQVQLSATPWTVACQTSLSMGFPKQDYWSGLSFPPPGDLPNPCIKLMSPALQDEAGDRARTWAEESQPRCSPDGSQTEPILIPEFRSPHRPFLLPALPHDLTLRSSPHGIVFALICFQKP